jgi:DNA-binding LytR/AlgR family response regulator
MNMKETKVLILEDQESEAVHLQSRLLELGYQVPAVATSLAEGLAYLELYNPDICLVDVYLDGRPDGIVFGLKLNETREVRKPFLFLTSSVESSTFAMAKASRPSSFLIKPFNEPELDYAIELALDRSNRDLRMVSTGRQISPQQDSVFVKRGNSMIRIKYEDIHYIEVDGKYSKLVCNNQKFVVQQALGEVQASLPQEQFFRIHRKYVININLVEKIDVQTHEIFFKDGSTLFFSRRYLEEFISMSKCIR